MDKPVFSGRENGYFSASAHYTDSRILATVINRKHVNIVFFTKIMKSEIHFLTISCH